MQRKTTFLLSLERLEDRRVLSATSTADLAHQLFPTSQVSLPPEAQAVVAQAEAMIQRAEAAVQQAEANAQQRFEGDLLIVQMETLAREQQDAGQPPPAETNQGNGNGSSSSVASQTTGNSASSGHDTSQGSTAVVQTPGQAGPAVGGGNTVRPVVNDNEAITPPAAANVVAVVNPIRPLGSGLDSANPGTGLTATPTQQNVSRDASSALTVSAFNSATGMEVAANTATITPATAGTSGVNSLVAPPTPFSFFGVTPLPGIPADLSGANLRAYNYGDTRQGPDTGFIPAGAIQLDDSSLELSVPRLIAADLLNGSAPQGDAALDLGVRQFLMQLDDLGHDLAGGTSVTLWVAAVAFGVVTYEVARRRRRARLALGYAGAAHHPADSWVPGLSGPLGSEEP